MKVGQVGVVQVQLQDAKKQLKHILMADQESSTGNVIEDRLVRFKSIEQCIQQNEDMRLVIRELSAQYEQSVVHAQQQEADAAVLAHEITALQAAIRTATAETQHWQQEAEHAASSLRFYKQNEALLHAQHKQKELQLKLQPAAVTQSCTECTLLKKDNAVLDASVAQSQKEIVQLVHEATQQQHHTALLKQCTQLQQQVQQAHASTLAEAQQHHQTKAVAAEAAKEHLVAVRAAKQAEEKAVQQCLVLLQKVTAAQDTVAVLEADLVQTQTQHAEQEKKQAATLAEVQMQLHVLQTHASDTNSKTKEQDEHSRQEEQHYYHLAIRLEQENNALSAEHAAYTARMDALLLGAKKDVGVAAEEAAQWKQEATVALAAHGTTLAELGASRAACAVATAAASAYLAEKDAARLALATLQKEADQLRVCNEHEIVQRSKLLATVAALQASLNEQMESSSTAALLQENERVRCIGR